MNYAHLCYYSRPREEILASVMSTESLKSGLRPLVANGPLHIRREDRVCHHCGYGGLSAAFPGLIYPRRHSRGAAEWLFGARSPRFNVPTGCSPWRGFPSQNPAQPRYLLLPYSRWTSTLVHGNHKIDDTRRGRRRTAVAGPWCSR